VPRLDPARAAAIATGFPRVTLLVLGDLMLDHFVWGSVTRISPEAPVPVVRMERESHLLGGAGNVARNVVAMGGRAVPVGVRGDDRDGEQLARLCREAGIAGDGVMVVPGRPTTVKTRVVAHHQHVVRVDREEDGPLGAAIETQLARRALDQLDASQALIISDYDKGAISPDLLKTILPEAIRRGLPVVVDPKVRLFDHYRPATVVTPNAREAIEAAGRTARTDHEFEAISRELRARLGCPYLLVTRGERGMLLVGENAPSLLIPTVAREVYDVTGAGDTVVATLALALAAGATMEEAAILANQAAGVAVGKIGTAAVTLEDLLGSLGRAGKSAQG